MDLSALSPQQIQAIQAILGSGGLDPQGRTPMRDRQLHDLRLLPTATDARPTFFWSAEAPRDALPYRHQSYPALVWHRETGQERRVDSAAERAALGDVWVDVPPMQTEADHVDDLTAALASLTDAERLAILGAQQQQRLQALQDQIAALPESELARLLEGVGAEAPAPRKRGRPAKVQAA